MYGGYTPNEGYNRGRWIPGAEKPRIPAIPYADIAHMSEDERIRLIGQEAMKGGQIGFVVESEPGKVERYVNKLLAAFPELELINKILGPTVGTVTCIVRKKK